MTTLTIPWDDGSGESFEISYERGVLNDTLHASTPPNTSGKYRCKRIEFWRTDGDQEFLDYVIVSQLSENDYDGEFADTAEEDYVRTIDGQYASDSEDEEPTEGKIVDGGNSKG